MRRTPAVAQFLLVVISVIVVTTNSVQGSLVFFDDRELFMQAIADRTWMEDDFSDLEAGYVADPILRAADTPFEYLLGSSSIVGLMVLENLISTVLPKSAFEIEATSGEIQAFGGDFGLTDYNGVASPGVLQVQLPDGSSIARTIDDVAGFVGFIGVGETLDSLVIGSQANLQLVTAASLVVAVTPAPGALVLFCVAAMGSRRTRQRS